jgi:hypothetical protein
MRMSTCNNDVINIYEKKHFDTARDVKEERIVHKDVVNPRSRRNWDSLVYQALGACLRP